MITEYKNEYREVGAVYFDAVHFIASQFSTPAEIDAWAPVPHTFDDWKVRCEAKRPFLYKVASQVAGFLELDADGHIGGHFVAPRHAKIAAPLLDHAISVARDRGTVKALFVEAPAASSELYKKFGFRFVESVSANLSDRKLASVRLCKFL